MNPMNDDLNIVFIENPEQSAWGIIGRGVGNYNKELAGDNNFQRLCFVLQGFDEEIRGGVVAEIY